MGLKTSFAVQRWEMTLVTREPGEREGSLLIVDDDAQVAEVLRRILTAEGYTCHVARDATEARALLAAHPFAIALVDVRLPDESGIDLARDIAAGQGDLAVVMISGIDDPDTAGLALEGGAYGYVIKPFRPNDVRISIAGAARRRALEIENRSCREDLERRVTARTAELTLALERLRLADEQIRRGAEDMVHALSRTIEHRDEETSAHVERMSRYAALIAAGYGFDDERTELIRLASPMHDVGKLAVPDGILFKPGRLSAAEFDVIKTHTERGERILGKSDSDLVVTAAVIARSHHERWDGNGYPDGLSGEEIPIEGRIASVADVFDAMVSRRVYKPAFPTERVIEHLRDGRGTQFDGALVDIFLDSMDDVAAIQAQYPDDLAVQ